MAATANANRRFGDSPLLKEATAEIRAGFVRKVYGILSAQLAMTVAVALPLASRGQRFLYSNAGLMIAATVLMCLSVMVMSCCHRIANKFPLNYFLLFIFTIAQGVIVGGLCAAYTWTSVGLAASSTALVFFAMTVYAFTSKTDFTGMGTYLFAGLISLCVSGLVFSVLAVCGIYVPALTMVCDAIGVVVFTMYIVCDTQMIIQGEHEIKFGIDEYVFAAMMLYADIINLFVKLLKLFGEFENKKRK